MTASSTYIVTGGNTGLGFECAADLAADSRKLVVIACRDARDGQRAADRIGGGNVRVLALDLSDQPSIHGFVKAFRAADFPPLAAVVCNAGSQTVSEPTKTADGYETTFAVNHLGHFLLTRLLLQNIVPSGRITFVSSGTHDPEQKTGMPAPRYTNAESAAHDFEPGGAAGRRRYTTSKLCNVLTTYEYARRLGASADPRLHSIHVNAFDPGLMPATGLARTYPPTLRFISRYILPILGLFISNVNSPKASGRRLAALASGGKGDATGLYFSEDGAIRSSAESYDVAKARELWESSSAMVGLPSDPDATLEDR